MSTLTDRIRELKVTEHVRELNWNEWPTFEGADLLHEANIAVSYSNGAHQSLKMIHRLIDEADENTPMAQIAELTSLKWHMIFLDFVWQGLGQVFNGPVRLPTNILSAVHYYRSLDTAFPPWHSHIERGEGQSMADFHEIPIEAGHGQLPAAPKVQDAVCQRVKELIGA